MKKLYLLTVIFGLLILYGCNHIISNKQSDNLFQTTKNINQKIDNKNSDKKA